MVWRSGLSSAFNEQLMIFRMRTAGSRCAGFAELLPISASMASNSAKLRAPTKRRRTLPCAIQEDGRAQFDLRSIRATNCVVFINYNWVIHPAGLHGSNHLVAQARRLSFPRLPGLEPMNPQVAILVGHGIETDPQNDHLAVVFSMQCVKDGISSTHAVHQVVQKLINTTLPRKIRKPDRFPIQSPKSENAAGKSGCANPCDFRQELDGAGKTTLWLRPP